MAAAPRISARVSSTKATGRYPACGQACRPRVSGSYNGCLRTDPAATTLLLIEDHRDIAEMIAEYFEQRGFAIDHAADGLTGLHLAVTNPYDVIIADVMLAGMDGITICRKLREEARRDTPIPTLTARDTIDDKLSGLDA